MGILVGVKWKTSQAAYNGPKEQWYKNLKKKGQKSPRPFVEYIAWIQQLCSQILQSSLLDPFQTSLVALYQRNTSFLA